MKFHDKFDSFQKGTAILDAFNLDVGKVLNLKRSVESENKRAVALVLPQITVLGLKIEFSDKAISPGIRWD